MRIQVILTPGEPPASFPGWPREHRAWSGVAIDVLRATSTLAVALSNGALRVLPAASAEEARAIAARRPGALLCGEREGQKIPGFDLGNSPFEYAPEIVRGRDLVFASTNGSLALQAITGCGRRRIGAFVNASALVEALAAERHVLLVCAGKLGRFSLEDAAFAGWICAALKARGAELDGASARFVRTLAPADANDVRALVEGASHARYLRRLGPEFVRDIEFCATLDSIDRAFEV